MEGSALIRKLSRVGGSVVVAIPKEIRRKVNLGVGDRVKMWPVEGRFIVIEKQEGVRSEGTRLKD